MAKYHNRPKVVEAEQWEQGKDVPGVFRLDDESKGDFRHYVVTIHGQKAFLQSGDYVVTEPDGVHHYPVKPDIFEANYYPIVQFCNWCPVPEKPSPAHHSDGKPEHVPLHTWADIAEGLRRAGWTVELQPLFGMPDYQWRSPAGISGTDYRSSHPQAPPEAVMCEAFAAGVVGFLHLAGAGEEGPMTRLDPPPTTTEMIAAFADTHRAVQESGDVEGEIVCPRCKQTTAHYCMYSQGLACIVWCPCGFGIKQGLSERAEP